MKKWFATASILTMLIGMVSGCAPQKSERDMYVDASKKLLELYKSDEFWSISLEDQQTRMQQLVKESGLELGATMDEQTKNFKLISQKYKDDPEIRQLNQEMQKAVYEHMAKDGNLAPPPAEGGHGSMPGGHPQMPEGHPQMPADGAHGGSGSQLQHSPQGGGH